MQKRMYSLILMDEVVRAADKLAHKRGTSRSNLINQVLAEYLSLTTPEMRIEDIFRRASAVAEGENSLQLLTSNGMLQIKSVLNYRYNPAIRYTIEISPDGEHYSGVFRVLSRTQSKPLLSQLNVFFEIWAQIEHYCLSSANGRKPDYEISAGRYRRVLCVEDGREIHDSHRLGEAIGAYVQLFDSALELFFSANSSVDMEIYQQMIGDYKAFLNNTAIRL